MNITTVKNVSQALLF